MTPDEKLPPLHFLLIEDIPEISDLTAQGLQLYAQNQSRELDLVRHRTLHEGRQFLAEKSRRLDLALLDLGLPDGWGHELIPDLLAHSPALTIIVHTIFEDDSNLLRALGLGASGYLVKCKSADEVASMLWYIDQGWPPLSPAVARRLLTTFRNSEPPPKAPLTPKEFEVIQYLARGLTNQETADCLEISAHTVATHVKSIYRKLQVSTRAEMTGMAQKNGWVAR